jgi:hypothetical protein
MTAKNPQVIIACPGDVLGPHGPTPESKLSKMNPIPPRKETTPK